MIALLKKLKGKWPGFEVPGRRERVGNGGGLVPCSGGDAARVKRTAVTFQGGENVLDFAGRTTALGL